MKEVHQESMLTQLNTTICIVHVGKVAMVCAEPHQPSLPLPTIPWHISV